MGELLHVPPQRVATKFRVDSAWGDLHMSTRDPRDYLPDIRDGLTHRERVVLQRLSPLPKERTGESVGTLCRAGSSC